MQDTNKINAIDRIRFQRHAARPAIFFFATTILSVGIAMAADVTYPALAPLPQTSPPNADMAELGRLLFFDKRLGGDMSLSCALNLLNGEKGAKNLRNRNGERDYLIGVSGGQWGNRLKNIPITVGADLFYNFEDYSAADVAPFPAAEAADNDEVLGYVFSVQLGQLKEHHDWLVGYYYSHIETFAVNASYAQDDWIRFGSGAQTDSSDFEGHEIRLGYSFRRISTCSPAST